MDQAGRSRPQCRRVGVVAEEGAAAENEGTDDWS